MNFISSFETGGVRMELKYCERCGGLWLRPQGADVVYCRGCQECMAALPRVIERPAPGPRKRRKQEPRKRDLQSQHLQGLDFQNKDLQSHDPIEFLGDAPAIEVRP
jgi:hypothetical protein